MKALFILCVLFTIAFQQAFAAQIECKASKNGSSILIKGKSYGLLNSEASGSLFVDNTEVSRFESANMNWDMLDKSFVFENNQGDKIEGKFDNYTAGLVTISKLIVRGKYSWTNIKSKCKNF